MSRSFIWFMAVVGAVFLWLYFSPDSFTRTFQFFMDLSPKTTAAGERTLELGGTIAFIIAMDFTLYVIIKLWWTFVVSRSTGYDPMTLMGPVFITFFISVLSLIELPVLHLWSPLALETCEYAIAGAATAVMIILVWAMLSYTLDKLHVRDDSRLWGMLFYSPFAVVQMTIIVLYVLFS